MCIVLSGSGGIEHIVALVHGDLHTTDTLSTLKQVADCILSLFQKHTCRILLKHQSGKPAIAVCVLSC